MSTTDTTEAVSSESRDVERPVMTDDPRRDVPRDDGASHRSGSQPNVQAGELTATRRRGAYTVAYGVAVLTGIVPVFVSPQLWFVPVLAMAGYFLYGYGVSREGGFVFEFADSLYYLGFTLSVGSLLASLEPFHAASRP